MTYESEITKVETCAEGIWVTVSNVRRKDAAAWRGYDGEIRFTIPEGRKKAFWPGRSVEITLEPK